MLKFNVETIEQVEPEIRGLLQYHWEEVALDKDIIKLKPNWEAYKLLASLNALHILTVRDEGVLIGYYISTICQHLHYVDSKTAESDIFFILPTYRTGRTALRLFREHEKAMKELGVQKIYTTHKLHVNDIGNLLEALGYRHIENVYAKTLDKEQ